MPTYSYSCKRCGHEFDHFCMQSERNDTVCPECGSKRTKIEFKTAPAVHNYYSPMHPRYLRGMKR
jgi:putative FmdB family regulatory protein